MENRFAEDDELGMIDNGRGNSESTVNRRSSSILTASGSLAGDSFKPKGGRGRRRVGESKTNKTSSDSSLTSSMISNTLKRAEKGGAVRKTTESKSSTSVTNLPQVAAEPDELGVDQSDETPPKINDTRVRAQDTSEV